MSLPHPGIFNTVILSNLPSVVHQWSYSKAWSGALWSPLLPYQGWRQSVGCTSACLKTGVPLLRWVVGQLLMLKKIKIFHVYELQCTYLKFERKQMQIYTQKKFLYFPFDSNLLCLFFIAFISQFSQSILFILFHLKSL